MNSIGQYISYTYGILHTHAPCVGTLVVNGTSYQSLPHTKFCL